MKLSFFSAASVGLSILGVALLQACSDDPPSAAPDGGPNDGVSLRRPVERPNAPATTSTEEHNYAIHRLYLGGVERTPTGARRNDDAWRNLGFDLDGKKTDATSTDVCTLAPGAVAANQVDGDDGIDNSFGQNVVSLLRSFQPELEAELNTSFDIGSFTVMFDITGLDDQALSSQTATGVTGRFFAGTLFSPTARPTWTVADDWPVNPDLLENPSDPRSSKVRFPDAYVVAGTFVNGTPADVPLSLSIAGIPFTMTVHSAIITFEHGAKGKASNGVIAGAVDTEEFIRGLRQVIGNVSPAACGLFETLANQIRQAADIVLEGNTVTNRAGVPCNAISVGLGFEADEIGIPTRVGEPSNGADSCNPPADGGTDGGGGDADGAVDAGEG